MYSIHQLPSNIKINIQNVLIYLSILIQICHRNLYYFHINYNLTVITCQQMNIREIMYTIILQAQDQPFRTFVHQINPHLSALILELLLKP